MSEPPTRPETSRDRQLARVLAPAECGKGSAYAWLRKRHDAFAAGVRASDFPGWPETHRRLVALGLKDGAGKAPTLRGLQAIWYRVARDVRDARAAKPGPVPRVLPERSPGEIVPGVRPVAAPPEQRAVLSSPATSRPVGDAPANENPLARVGSLMANRSR